MLIFIISRSSVAPGDDLTDRDKYLNLSLKETDNLGDLLHNIIGQKFLPTISGGQATWIVSNAQPLAVITQQEKEPKYLIPAETRIEKLWEGGSIRCVYWCQQDPDLVYMALKNHLPLPSKYRK